jgi:hypothetical protein
MHARSASVGFPIIKVSLMNGLRPRDTLPESFINDDTFSRTILDRYIQIRKSCSYLQSFDKKKFVVSSNNKVTLKIL